MTTPTREVANQSTDLVDYNLFTSNPALVDALAREGSVSDHDRADLFGESLDKSIVGSFLYEEARWRRTDLTGISDFTGRGHDGGIDRGCVETEGAQGGDGTEGEK